jgi:hypothetical protein
LFAVLTDKTALPITAEMFCMLVMVFEMLLRESCHDQESSLLRFPLDPMKRIGRF